MEPSGISLLFKALYVQAYNEPVKNEKGKSHKKPFP